MTAFARRASRWLVLLVPLALVLLDALGLMPIRLIHTLDQNLYDTWVRHAMPHTRDERVVIVDIDEASLAVAGQWPWRRDKLAALVAEIVQRQQAAVLGFDMVFAERDAASGVDALRALAASPAGRAAALNASQIEALARQLDTDAQLARAIAGQPVVLGYYFTSEQGARAIGQLPAPLLPTRFAPDQLPVPRWDGYGANLPVLADSAGQGGFFNTLADSDGVVRALPLLALHNGQLYESLGLAMFRSLAGQAAAQPVFAAGPQAMPSAGTPAGAGALKGIELRQEGRSRFIPTDATGALRVPFRGAGGPAGGSFRYISAADLLAGKLPAGSLQERIVILGTTAPGLRDLRATPVSETYPGVETHANLLVSLLDQHYLTQPDYADGYNAAQIVLTGLLALVLLPLLPVATACALGLGLMGALAALNYTLFSQHGLVLPLAGALLMLGMMLVLNLGHGYFAQNQRRQGLIRLFSTYAPPELVQEMAQEPERYSMKAAERELTVMFCDMRGFTRMSEGMAPAQVQSLLNQVFSRLTQVIYAHRGTIDKYMGDCVMAFWGAPVHTSGHAAQAVAAALEMVHEIARINAEHRQQGRPPIGVGIGLSTGTMFVGDMGSDVRVGYTVIGDAVNLGARLEALCRFYGVDIIANEATRQQTQGQAGWRWQEVDCVRVKGRAQVETIFTPLPAPQVQAWPEGWACQWAALRADYRAGHWVRCQQHLRQMAQENAEIVKYSLYQCYAQRVASYIQLPPSPEWDGVTDFETQ